MIKINFQWLVLFLLCMNTASLVYTGSVYGQEPEGTVVTDQIVSSEVVSGELIVEEEEFIYFDAPPLEDAVDPNAGNVALDAETDSAAPQTSDPALAITPFAGTQQLFLPSVTTTGIAAQEGSISSGVVYYVDCNQGNDNATGRATTSAWRTVSRANQAALQPGDNLLFKRGCAWTGPLQAKWHGTSVQPILIGAYGSGDLPKFQNGYTFNVRITGSYQHLSDLHATLTTPPNPDPNCGNQPRGWKAGFAFDGGSSYNTITTSKATKLTIGVYFDVNSHHNRLLNSTITDNNVVQKLTATVAHGATAVSLHGDSNEVGYNYFANNRTICTYNGVVESNSIELYKARNSNIHHNRAFGDRVFSELGTDSSYRAENNTFAYNLHVTTYSHNSMGARFVVTRGYGHQFGPMLNTKLYNNLVYFTGTGSKGVTCGECGYNILTMRNNILWANGEPFVSDAPLTESHNLFWSSNGSPMLRWHGFSKSATSRIANPSFVDPANNNFNLRSSSPAINQASLDVVTAGYKVDLAKIVVPLAGIVDIGAYEYSVP